MNRRQKIYLLSLLVYFSFSGGLIYYALNKTRALVAVGSTFIAVGGSIFYYLYQEYVEQPEIKIVGDGVKFEKFLLFNSDPEKEVRGWMQDESRTLP